MSPPWSTLTHLECSRTGARADAGRLQGLSAAGAPLLARYDLERAARTLRRDALGGRRRDMWRYHEVLPAPAPEDVVTLGEGATPLLPATRLAARLDLGALWIKDEAQNPTGSFKARGLAAAVTMAARLGARVVAMPTAGNAGGAAAAYAARAGLEAEVFVPADAPRANHVEAGAVGARVTVVDGTLLECARAVAARAGAAGWFELSTFKEPYRVEGKKTLAYELVEQMDGALPDAILWPTGGGTGLVAMWKAFDEMEALGWIDSRRPRMVAVQAAGCAPLVRALESGADAAEEWERPTTRVAGLRAPRMLADFLCLEAVRASGGTAVAIDDATMLETVRTAGALEGVFLCPEAAACVAALKRLREGGSIRAGERVVVFNTAAGVKYVDLMAELGG